MVFCIEKWMQQEQINAEHGDALKRIENSLELKERAINELAANNAANKKMIDSLSECVKSIKDSNKDLKEYHDKNLKYFETIIQNMITVEVFTRNVKWLSYVIIAVGVIWKAFEELIK